MRKLVQFSILLLAGNLFFTAVSAQLPKALAFGNFTYANTGGDFKNYSNYGIGYEIGGGVGLGKTMIMGSVGSIRYNIPGSTTGSLAGKGHVNVTPIKVGIRQYLLLGLFLNGNLGLATGGGESPVLYELGAGAKLGFFEIGAAYSGYKVYGYTNNAVLFKGGIAIKI
ncbi:hypothetical protein GWC95_14410 [Sediminibacterium roseum]|uniref:Outer membrane protein beta-barrel domain-containing protein n=1 Tax=Sediminibacterium roseum TaxID=1978412 RepID=A0ABW9ZVC6_9BACT|nr:hypothetical protein [Sediminibacterium roseum]NCI51122.1 hypothetical protein [Sediminibacterium roseum]